MGKDGDEINGKRKTINSFCEIWTVAICGNDNGKIEQNLQLIFFDLFK